MWQKFLDSFHRSEVIIWARVQTFVGIVLLVISETNLSPLFVNVDPKWFVYYTIANGVLTEALRRNRAAATEPDWSPTK